MRDDVWRLVHTAMLILSNNPNGWNWGILI
jgi:hypothetical protein